MITYNKQLKKLLCIPLGFCVALLFVELILRIIGYSYSPLKITWKNEDHTDTKVLGITDRRQFHQTEEYFTPDNKIIWRPINNKIIFNSQGLRGPVLDIAKKKDDYRIFALGDSNTLGPVDSNSWVEYLAEKFKKFDPNVKVVNAGVWGYTSFQGYMKFQELLEYKPDLVLVSFGANDAHRVTIEDKEYIETKKFFNSSIMKIKLTQLIFALDDMHLMYEGIDKILVPRVSERDYGQYLNNMIELARKNNIKIVFLTRPYIGEPESPLVWKKYAPEYRKITIEIADKNNIPLIDVYSYFKDKPKYFVDESHFNDEGYKILSEMIYDNIKL